MHSLTPCDPICSHVRFTQTFRLVALCALATLTACRDEDASVIRLNVGGANGWVRFVPKAAFAQYVELPGLANELQITLAGYPASCERFVPPKPGQASVSVLIKTPHGEEPTAKTYPWAGHSAHGGSPAQPKQAYAIPSARIGAASYVFPPGGSVTIKDIRLVANGHVSGELAFEFPGNAASERKSIKGRFHANICRFDEAYEHFEPGQILHR